MAKRILGYFPTLKDYTDRAGISQAELARSANVSRSTVSRAEAGKPVTVSTLNKIVSALNTQHGLDLDPREVTLIDPPEPWPKK